MLMNIIEFARSETPPDSAADRLPLTSFQEMILSESTTTEFRQVFFNSILDWILGLEHIPKSFSNQPTVIKCLQVHVSKVFVLLSCVPDPSEFQVDPSSKQYQEVFNLGLGSLLTKVKSIDELVFINASEKRLTDDEALHYQEQSYLVMMLAFKHWINDNTLARQFLRDHDGFNFMLERLFSNSHTKLKDKPKD